MKRICILIIAICMMNIANAQQKNLPIPNLGKEAINNPLNDNLPNHKNLKQKATKAITWNVDTEVAYDTNNTFLRRITQTFNNNGNLLTNKTESWQNNAWVNYSKGTYTYDTNGIVLTLIIECWQNNAWVNANKVTYTYDANGNCLTQLVENWQINAWVNNNKYSFTYDANGNWLTQLVENWQTNAWVNNSKYTFTYDANGDNLNCLYQGWNTNAWINISKYTYTYDANGNLLTSLSETWQNNAWVNQSKSTFTYDANGNRLTYLYEDWQNIYAWVNVFKKTYTYDAYGNSITGMYQIWVNNNWEMSSSGYLDVYSFKIKISGINAASYEAHFVSFTTGITENINNPINIYPNPATSNITLNLQQQTHLQNTTVSIYDMQGKLLIQQNITQPQTELNIAALAKGIYIVKVNNDTNSMQSKFVKE